MHSNSDFSFFHIYHLVLKERSPMQALMPPLRKLGKPTTNFTTKYLQTS